jgi:hypothetical protein
VVAQWLARRRMRACVQSWCEVSERRSRSAHTLCSLLRLLLGCQWIADRRPNTCGGRDGSGRRSVSTTMCYTRVD